MSEDVITVEVIPVQKVIAEYVAGYSDYLTYRQQSRMQTSKTR
jgi:hypothetical protein